MEFHEIEMIREKLLICSVCMEEFEDPRIFPCYHTFCLDCIRDLVQSHLFGSHSQVLCCPQCRKNIAIPSGGIQKFPVNFYLSNLQEELTAAHPACQKCSSCRKVHAQFKQEDSDLAFCKFCIASRCLGKDFERSRFVRLPPSESSRSLASSPCGLHFGEALQLFCHTCHKAICIVCSCSKTHKLHNVSPLSKRFQEMHATLKKELAEVTRELQLACDSMSLIESFKESLISSSNESISNLNDVAVKSCETIMKLKSEFESEIKASTEKQITTMESIEMKMHAFTDMLHKGQDFLSDLEETDVCIETIESYDGFSARVKERRECFTSTSIRLEQKYFAPSNNIHARNIKIGSFKTQFLYGNLGSLKSKQQNVSVNKETLKVTYQPWKMLRLPSFRTVLMASLLIGMILIAYLLPRVYDGHRYQIDGWVATVRKIGLQVGHETSTLIKDFWVTLKDFENNKYFILLLKRLEDFYDRSHKMR